MADALDDMLGMTDVPPESSIGTRFMILAIPEHQEWPRHKAGRYWWYPALDLVCYIPKGLHNPTEEYPITARKNSARGALVVALRAELKRTG